MKLGKRILSVVLSAALTASALFCGITLSPTASTEPQPEWGTLGISGGGFVSGLICGDSQIYCRTDVGGAYRYENGTWVQLLSFLSEDERGLLCVEAMCIDPNDDDTLYLLCGCNYFSDARTVIFKSTDAGETFTQSDVSDYIRVHGNGDGRQQGERIAVDPNNTNILYAGGRTGGLIKSTDGGKTWSLIYTPDAFNTVIKWPEWTDLELTSTANKVGISTVYVDENSRLYVGVSTTGATNLFTSTNGGASFSALSSSLPTNMFIARINPDSDGNLLLAYQGGVVFAGSGGGAYKYNITTGAVTNISPGTNSIGQIQSLPNDSSKLFATTCGVWATQCWDENTIVWGEWMYVSQDGGASWTTIYPGKKGDWYWDPATSESRQDLLYDYLQDGGVSWVQGKAIHWSGSLIVNPNNTDQVLVTSGNGIFSWDGLLTDDPVATFHAKGIEEVVALDFCSVEGGNNFSAIGDYDGFIHYDTDTAVQHKPNFGSSCSISYCKDNSNIMMRIPFTGSQSTKGQYSTDAGLTWTEFGSSPGNGGDSAIVKLSNGEYRFICGKSDGSALSYSDDYGATWKNSSGLSGGTRSMLETDDQDAKYVYAYSAIKSYSGETTHYYLNVSSDYGATFSAKKIEVNDNCADFRRITVVNGTVYCPLGWYGLFKTSDHGATFEKVENVTYCETIGCGAPKNSSSPDTLYMWGWVEDNTTKGIYASTDMGASWTRVNDDEHEYGGPGNGNFIVGDMNEFGTFYMSSVGVGIVYCKNCFSTVQQPEIMYGDINGDGQVNATDASMALRYAVGSLSLNSDQLLRGDVNGDNVVNATDAAIISRYAVGTVTKLPI